MNENKCENVKELTSIDRDSLGDGGVQFISEGHAIMNVVVLDNIMRYLVFDDIKTFRQVCHRWNDISEPTFWKKSRIKIINIVASEPEEKLESRFSDGKAQMAEDYNTWLIERFKSTFPSGMPSNAILFEGCVNREILDYFLKERGLLTLTNIYFRYIREPTKMCIDLNKLLTPNVTTLHIRMSWHAKLKISWKSLTNIQNLHLENCEILLNGKITPTELKIFGSNRMSYKEEVHILNHKSDHHKILLNEFVDFSKMRKLSLRGNILGLDVSSQAVHLETLNASNIHLVGLNNSQWTTNRFGFKQNIFIGDKMQIKSISMIDYLQVVDLQTLPSNVERIVASCLRQLTHPQMFSYQMLKYVSIVTYSRVDIPIFDFTNCTSLVDFYLKSIDHISKIESYQIVLPNCIKRVKLNNVQLTTSAPWQLDTLVLDHYSVKSVKNILNRVKTDKLTFATGSVQAKKIMPILNLWKNSNIQQLVLGAIDSSDENAFLKTEFAKSVDQIGKYFLFTKINDGKGFAIDDALFEGFYNLIPKEDDLLRKIFVM